MIRLAVLIDELPWVQMNIDCELTVENKFWFVPIIIDKKEFNEMKLRNETIAL